MVSHEDVSMFGDKYADVFGAEKIREQILADKDIEPRFSTFSTPSEHANDGRSLEIPGVPHPTVAHFNFHPWADIYRARTNDYVHEL
ncbi:MAG: hypothetical protein KIH89_001805 [Candidatus Shapirobacteria bacterium]|nr:hypothetical protein [Candidatus Shapirobacteria bacterium]